ncbi:MAG: hypothetical protein ACR2NU_17060 [Aeoliella sp.]
MGNCAPPAVVPSPDESDRTSHTCHGLFGDRFLNKVRTHARSRMIGCLRDQVTIDFAKLKGDAEYIGAAELSPEERWSVMIVQ